MVWGREPNASAGSSEFQVEGLGISGGRVEDSRCFRVDGFQDPGLAS